jgi:hypothetical protein
MDARPKMLNPGCYVRRLPGMAERGDKLQRGPSGRMRPIGTVEAPTPNPGPMASAERIVVPQYGSRNRHGCLNDASLSHSSGLGGRHDVCRGGLPGFIPRGRPGAGRPTRPRAANWDRRLGGGRLAPTLLLDQRVQPLAISRGNPFECRFGLGFRRRPSVDKLLRKPYQMTLHGPAPLVPSWDTRCSAPEGPIRAVRGDQALSP